MFHALDYHFKDMDDAEIVGKHPTQPGQSAESVGLATRPVQGAGKQLPEPFPIGVFDRQHLDASGLGRSTGVELGIDAVLEGSALWEDDSYRLGTAARYNISEEEIQRRLEEMSLFYGH